MAEGRADAAVGLRAAGTRLGLEKLPLFDEQYDLVIPRETFEAPLLESMLEHLRSERFRRAVGELDGYDAGVTGRATPLSA